MLMFFVLVICQDVRAEEEAERVDFLSVTENQPELFEGYATAYCLQGKTASGQFVRNGICATGRKEWFGKVAVLYQRLPDGRTGELIGIYEILDTGCKESVIDVWCEDLDECQEFMNRVYENGCKGKIFIQIIDADG